MLGTPCHRLIATCSRKPDLFLRKWVHGNGGWSVLGRGGSGQRQPESGSEKPAPCPRCAVGDRICARYRTPQRWSTSWATTNRLRDRRPPNRDNDGVLFSLP